MVTITRSVFDAVSLDQEVYPHLDGIYDAALVRLNDQGHFHDFLAAEQVAVQETLLAAEQGE